MIRLLAGVVVLSGIYAGVLGSAAWPDLVLGAVVGAAVLAGTRARVRPATPGVLRRVLRFFPFAAAVVADVAVGTWDVALVVLGARPLRTPGVVEVPIGDRTRRGLAVSALALTLSPCSLLIDVDADRRLMLVHVIDATDADAVRAKFNHFYERWQRPVFP